MLALSEIGNCVRRAADEVHLRHCILYKLQQEKNATEVRKNL